MSTREQDLMQAIVDALNEAENWGWRTVSKEGTEVYSNFDLTVRYCCGAWRLRSKGENE